MKRYLLPLCVLIILSGMPKEMRAQEDIDRYSLDLVKAQLKLAEQGFRISVTEKRLNKLGDKVSIALIRLLREDELRSPQKLRAFLPLIRSSFLHPMKISAPADRNPKVTLSLLEHLELDVEDPSLKKEVSQLKSFIKQKAIPSDGN